MLISLNNIGLSFGAEQILNDVSVTVEPNERIALIGPNGAGKTTILNIIAGLQEADAGSIAIRPDVKIGYLRQNGGLSKDSTIQSEMRLSLSKLFETEDLLLETGEKMSAVLDHGSEEYKELERQYQRFEEQFAALDGYGAQVKINTILTGMGFSTFDRETPVSTMSGGERTRLMLCKLLVEQPLLLILDEATNHLDFTMLAWLEDYLIGYKGAIITVSHDRWFLNKVTNVTWELEGLSIVRYPAAYNNYLVLKQERIERIEKEYERHLREVEKLADYAERNMARASTSQSAKSRLKMIEHLGDPIPPPGIVRPPRIRFQPRLRPVSDVLAVRGLTLTVGEGESKRVLLSDFSLHVKRGDRVAVIGENGAGKSTLLKTIAGRLKCDKGEIEWGRNVEPSFFEQDSSELHPEKTVIGELWDRFPRSNERELRTLVGGLGLTGEEAFKKVSTLSGGERARLKLAAVIMEQGNLMMMDEPTNHLDIPAKETLEAALMAFEGTLIIVSHDRWLLSRIPTVIVRLDDGKVQCFTEGFEAMQEELAAQKLANEVPKPQNSSAQRQYRTKAQRSAEVSSKLRQQELEKEIATVEQRRLQVEAELASDEVSADYQRLTELSAELAELEASNVSLYDEWDELLEQM